jgi:hypothetical protein
MARVVAHMASSKSCVDDSRPGGGTSQTGQWAAAMERQVCVSHFFSLLLWADVDCNIPKSVARKVATSHREEKTENAVKKNISNDRKKKTPKVYKRGLAASKLRCVPAQMQVVHNCGMTITVLSIP